MEMRFFSEEQLILPDEIKNLLPEGAIKESQHEAGEFISPLFLRQNLTIHVTYAFESESTLYSCLNVKELLARSRREI